MASADEEVDCSRQLEQQHGSFIEHETTGLRFVVGLYRTIQLILQDSNPYRKHSNTNKHQYHKPY